MMSWTPLLCAKSVITCAGSPSSATRYFEIRKFFHQRDVEPGLELALKIFGADDDRTTGVSDARVRILRRHADKRDFRAIAVRHGFDKGHGSTAAVGEIDGE